MRSHHATVLSLNKTMRSKAGGRRGEQTSRVLKLIAAAFVVKCFNLKIRPEQKTIFFLLSLSLPPPPALFKWIASPAFVDALAASVWVEGRSMSVYVYVKGDCQPLRQETTGKKSPTHPVDSVTLTSRNLLASSLKPVCLVLFYNTFTLLSTKLTICLEMFLFFLQSSRK